MPVTVIVESPYAAKSKWWLVALWQRWRNRVYARQCCLDCVLRGESPLASHLLGPQYLDDNDPVERRLGIECGLAWGFHAEKTIAYVDYGISAGMQLGIDNAQKAGRPVIHRRILSKGKVGRV